MAEAATEPLPNGNATTAEEEERLKQRPADIDADVREMERRKRVEALMSSKLFREELERVLDQQMHEGGDAPLLQRIREMVGGRLHTGTFRSPSCVLPINDIRGIEGFGYEKGEKILRCKLAACYRLVDLFGWTQTGLTGQITARLNTAVEQVLTTPRGLLPHEVTASALVKVDMQGVVQDQGTTNFPPHQDGFSLHASVHAARPDLRCVLHVRSPGALAVSSTKRGLLPLTHEAALLGDVAYHRVPHGILDNEEHEKLVRALGPSAKVLMVSGGGALCCGASLEEAFYHARQLTAACDVQLRLAAVPLDDLLLLDEDTRRQVYEQSRTAPAGDGKWRVGGEEFEALMRMLDNAGFRTGYIYRHPLVKNEVPKPKNDVEVPPAVSSLGYLLEEEELYRQGIWKKGTGKAGERTRWLNSPNVYQKVEVLETGTTDPKKITKWVDANNEEWVQDGSPAHSGTPVKIDTLQFVPKNTNPKEFKALQQQIKDNRRADKISAGPQSHILEGVTWDEASKLVAEDAHNTHTGDHVVLMGAASKGIIQRGHQHNATVYSAPYARNPFEHVTDNEIAEYRRTVERRARSDYDTDLSESEAISAAQITSPASAPSETEEESRDEHRVLRIETKQVPVRSQPEVVLSDGTKLTEATEALCTSKRSLHDYPRNNNVERMINHFDDDKKQPKCKVSLHDRLGDKGKHNDDENAIFASGSVKSKLDDNKTRKSHSNFRTNETVIGLSQIGDSNENIRKLEEDNLSSRSSLYSIQSLEWDGRCKSEYVYRTQSLPRKKSKTTNLFRTRSYSGFANSYIKDPEPLHFHLPKCRSCGSSTSSYVWELTRERKAQKSHSVYFSVDNIHQACNKEEMPDTVKIKERFVPVFKVAEIQDEFVESQEFNEDNYLTDLNSFSTDNETIIEKTDFNDVEGSKSTEGESDLYKAEVVQIEAYSSDNIASEGEYLSFSDEMDFDGAYESPVKDLVEKDIRDYSIPINFYCEYYAKSPKKSPKKISEVVKQNLILEPILEESKSSNDETNSSTNNSASKTDSDIVEITKNIDEANNQTDPLTESNDIETMQTDLNEMSHVDVDATKTDKKSNVVDTDIEKTDDDYKNNVPTTDDSVLTTNFAVFPAQANKTGTVEKSSSVSYANTTHDESVFKIPQLLNRTETSVVRSDNEIKERNSNEYSIASSTDLASFDLSAEFEKYEVVTDILSDILKRIDCQADLKFFIVKDFVEVVTELEIYPLPMNETTCDISNTSDSITSENFSITKIVEKLEGNLNETASTEASVVESQSHIIAESILYFIFNRACYLWTNKDKNKTRQVKRVVTIVDSEDILFTAATLWPEIDGLMEQGDDEEITIEKTGVHVEKTDRSSGDTLSHSIHVDELKNDKSVGCDIINNILENICFNELETATLPETNSKMDHRVHVEKNNCCRGSTESHSKDNEALKNDTSIGCDMMSDILDNMCFNKLETGKLTYTNYNEMDHYQADISAVNKSDFHAFDIEAQIREVSSTEADYLNEEPELETNEQNVHITEDNFNDGFLFDNSNNSINVQNNNIRDETKQDVVLYTSYVPDNHKFNENQENYDLDEILQNVDEYEDDDLNNNNSEPDNANINIMYQTLESHNTPDLAKEHNLDNLNVTFTVEVDDSNNEAFIAASEVYRSDETFLVSRDMNTAFVHEDYFNSRSSSPQKEQGNFEVCTVSPITYKNPDTSILYEKEDSILGSPFVKRASVISMSQNEHSGGVKYWLSFDNSLTDTEPYRSVKKFTDNKMPSFFTVDFAGEFKPECKRSSILHDNYNRMDNSNVGIGESFATAKIASDNYDTCDSGVENEPRKMLLYDSRPELLSKNKRLYSSWPPFEDTLFYKIISKFRMSESFDPSDLGHMEILDKSL